MLLYRHLNTEQFPHSVCHRANTRVLCSLVNSLFSATGVPIPTYLLDSQTELVRFTSCRRVFVPDLCDGRGWTRRQLFPPDFWLFRTSNPAHNLSVFAALPALCCRRRQSRQRFHWLRTQSLEASFGICRTYCPRNENIGPWRDVNRNPKKRRGSLHMRQYYASRVRVCLGRPRTATGAIQCAYCRWDSQSCEVVF